MEEAEGAVSMTTRDSQDGAPDLDRLDLGEINRFVRRRWRLILGTAGAASILALVACLSMTPIYSATSQVLLDPPKQRVFGQEQPTSDAALDSAVVDSQIPIILSTRTLFAVVQRQQLADDPEFAASAGPGLLRRLLEFFLPPRTASVEAPSLDGIDPKFAPVIARLFEHVDVVRVAKSNVLSITVASREANKSARLANAMAQAYVADQVGVHARSVQQAATFFEDRLGSLRNQVRQSEQAVADFRRKNGLATTTDEKVTVSEQQLTNLNERLAQASSDTAEKLAKFQQASQFRKGAGDLDTLPEVVRSPVINQLRAQQADVARREADLSVTYGDAYPAVTQIRAQRQGLAAAVAAEMKRLVSTLKNDLDVAKGREDTLRKTMAALGTANGGDNDVGVKLRELERANLANKALFENFLNKAKLTQEQSSFEAPDARLISPALAPAAPSSPKTKLIVPVAAVAGLILGLGLAAGLDLLGGKPGPLRAPSAPAAPEVPIFAAIPPIEMAGYAGAGAPLDAARYMMREPAAAFSSEVRALAARLAATGSGQVLQFAPLTAGAGCSALLRCTAAALGAAGKRVLLVDADGAARTVSRNLGLSARPGLAEVLAGAVPVAAAVVAQQAFAVLPSGAARLDIGSMLAKRRLRALLAEARPRFDLVLVDAAPRDDAGATRLPTDLVDRHFLVATTADLMQERFVGLVDAVTGEPRFAGLILNRTAPPLPLGEMAIAS